MAPCIALQHGFPHLLDGPPNPASALSAVRLLIHGQDVRFPNNPGTSPCVVKEATQRRVDWQPVNSKFWRWTSWSHQRRCVSSCDAICTQSPSPHITTMSLSLQCNVPAIKGRWYWNSDDRDLEETTLVQCDLKLLELQQRFSKQAQQNLFALLKWVSQPKIASFSCIHPSTVQPNLLANRKPSSISRHTTPRVFHRLDVSCCQLSPSTFGAFGSVFRPASTRANITFWVSWVSPKYASTFTVLYPHLQIKTRVGKILRARVHCLGVQIALWFNCRHCRTIPRSSAIRPCHISWSVSVSRRSTTLRSLPRPLPRPFMALAEITMTSWDIHGDRMVKDHNGLALGLKHAIRFFFLAKGRL